ncbi:recombination repair protein 1 isoform X1 [Drosophila busckii]|uniref:recombination repair protein 1 isoform X1 n=1 Tax=Drosophila busckii TaxID=30019 RepID=UPI00143301A5|nr:recombination repair protein 1 isoform X1 [Drosophila busckii]
MPRAKTNKKQAALDLQIENAIEISSSVSEAGSEAVSETVKPAAKGKARGEKTAAATAAGESNGEPVEVVPAKRTSSRKKKVVIEEPVPSEESDIEPVKPKGRAKKLPAEASEPAAAKKKTAKPRAKKENTPAPEEPEPSKGRVKKENPDTAEEKAPSKGRAKKEKPAAAEEPAVVKRGGKKSKELVDAAPVKEAAKAKGRGRKKKDTEPSDEPAIEEEVPVDSVANDVDKKPASSKRGRATKRLADEEIAEMLDEEEVEPEAATPKKRAKSSKKSKDNGVASPKKKHSKKASKKDKEEPIEAAEVAEVEEEEEGEKEVVVEAPPPTKKRAPKKENGEASKPARGRKRAATATPTEGEDDDDAADGSRSTLMETGCGSTVLKSLQNVLNFCFPASKTKKLESKAVVGYDKSQFEAPEDKEFNLKISSWNVAGLRAWLKKDGLKFVEMEEPDIFCLQETKCANDQLPEEMARLPGYHPYWLCMPGGYAGVAVYSKIMPIHIEYGIGNEDFDDVGRMITAEYEKFYLINVYVPNSGRKLVNLEKRMQWEQLFQEYAKKLDALKPLIIVGDMNVSHLEIDLANPKSNTRNAGFTKEERDKMSELLSLGFVDSFRHLYPKVTGAYSFWTYMANARARNVGWRLDYCIVSERFISRVVDNVMRSQCPGSDHCPITVFLNV